MYIYSAYWHQNRRDFKDKKHPIFVGSCGTYHLKTIQKLPTHRPRGRLDFQLLYIASGKGEFYFHGKKEIVTAGNMVIYRPKEEQRYYYYGVDQPEIYWVHFTGNNVTNILRKYGIPDDVHTIYTGTSLEYKRIFMAIIQELQFCKDDYEELCVHHLMELLIMIHRLPTEKPRKRNLMIILEMDQAVKYFTSNYNTAINIDDYALSHNLSISWFIQSFKHYTGTTPTQYILQLRISNAKNLLENTSYNISEISQIVGYENPLYFSRVFKKQSGLSPSEYRKRTQEVSSN